MDSPIAIQESPRRTDDAGSPGKGTPLGSDELHRMNAYWRASNYLSVGQIYLYDNPLLREPLVAEDVADCIAWTVTRPHHVNIDLMVVRPIAQAAQHKVAREG